MLIGAYRDNEVTPAHPLMRKLEAIRNAGAPVHEVRLAPLAREHVDQLIADALRCEPTRAAPLGQLVYEKTAGNPFFVIQFLFALADEGLLALDHRVSRWSWDLGRIHAKGYTANVADLMVGKLSRLPARTQEALQQLACLGNRGDIATLALGTSEEQLHADLWEAVRLELIERLDGAYRFVHDRVQEAVYSLIPEPSRADAHLQIGRLLAAHTPKDQREEVIFEIVNQLNRGVALISSPDEREELAELNLIAGKRAKDATAYASALTYLTAGRRLLPEDSWERYRALTFAFEIHRAECEFLTGAFAAAEERLSGLSSRVLPLVDLATLTRLKEELFTTLGRSDRAVEACLDYLRHIDVQWSPHPAKEEVQQEYERLWRQIGSRSIEDLVDLPLMTDPERRATMDVLSAALAPAVLTDDDLLFLVVCRMANLSLEHGNSDGSCFAYVWLGAVIGIRFGNYRAGFSFGKLGLDLVEQRGLQRFEARVCNLFAIISHWTQPVRTGLGLTRRSIDVANRLGDIAFAGFSQVSLIAGLLVTGEPLADVQREAEAGIDFARRFRFGLVLDMISPKLKLIQTLRGLTPEFGSFDDIEFDEGRFEQQLAEDPRFSRIANLYWLRKLQARFFAGAYASAVAAAANAHRLWPRTPSVLEQADYQLYAALTRAALCDAASGKDRTQHHEALAAHLRQLQEWAENCPENFADRAALVGAEIARLEGRELEAEGLYQQAIELAHANGFIQNKGLAYELAARFYAVRGFEAFADLYVRNARHCYLQWGADGKVRQLDQQYPQLTQEKPGTSSRSMISVPVEHLDLATVIKVLQAVSGEMVLEKLIDRLMRTAIEHAGAERGLLIVPRGDELQMEAEATTTGEDVTVQLGDGGHASAVLPESLVRYVMRTQEIVLLDDASSRNPFSPDPYIVQHHARSILCLALISRGKLIGILYLENNLTPHVFTPDRVTVLKVLASQAAISLENSRLYRDLEDREGKIRRLVDANILGIFIANLDGLIVEANEAFLRMVQYSRDDLVSRRVRWTDLTPAEWRERDERAVTEAKATGAAQPYEKEYFRKDGSRVPVLIGGALFQGGGNEGVLFVLDLSEQKRAEAEIRALKDRLYQENIALRDEVDRASMFEEIVGTSRPLKAVLSRIAKVAPTDSSVFIIGETGTGKELIARAVHKRSQRSGHAFVSVNCAALAPTLISSELFGHEKGAFTGATQRRLGRFELADGGTIFLDEVGELLPDTQVALLRVLQEREFERVGGGQPIHVDVRVIAATNRDLKALGASGTFRQDLFYRLNVFPIEVPPLRERKDDILMLVEYFMQRYATRAGKHIGSINKKSLDLLQSYDWPGNIRELQNVIERSVILCSGDVFSVDESWLSKDNAPPISRAIQSAVFKAEVEPRSEREIIEAALAETRGRVSGPSGAAARLGIPRSTLESRIRALKINKTRFKFG
jgi:PAS domain S-box-containing protein